MRTGSRTTIGRYCHWQFRLEQLRKEIAIGLEQLDRGEGIPGKAVFEKLRQRNCVRK
jgi:hypothetical protein